MTNEEAERDLKRCPYDHETVALRQDVGGWFIRCIGYCGGETTRRWPTAAEARTEWNGSIAGKVEIEAQLSVKRGGEWGDEWSRSLSPNPVNLHVAKWSTRRARLAAELMAQIWRGGE